MNTTSFMLQPRKSGRLLFILWCCVLSAAAQQKNVIIPGGIWPDNQGNHIQAHGGGIIKIGKTYYWYGEQRTRGLDTNYRYVSGYRSTDLVHWTFMGIGTGEWKAAEMPGLPVISKTFSHPGILHTQAALDHLYQVAQQKTLPEYGSYELLKDHPLASAQYKMNGPYSVISRDGEYKWTKSKMEADFSAAYLNALMWVATKEPAHARKSVEILEGYADSLTLIPATNDAPLLAGLEGTKIVNALEILRYTWKDFPVDKLGKLNRMLTGIFLPVCEKFYATPAYTNGNWGPIVTKLYLSAAIWFNNDTMYRKAIDFYYNARDNGTIRHYISGETGQIQESGRDQGHCQLGIGALATVCEIAWSQGDDLYGALDNRLLKGFEYVAKYNIGQEVPFSTWTDITGKYSNWTHIAEEGRGRFMPVYEMVYNHYVKRKGLAMPYTEQVIQRIRPEGYNRDQPAFGTLLFYGTK